MHREVLTRRAAELFPSLARFAGFYLAGGTGLAVQIGHRVSVDFDLFCPRVIKRTLLPRLETLFADAAPITPLVNNADELTALVDGIKVTFLSYPFPVVDPLEDCEGVPVLSIREIAATKAYTIGRRGEYKDYVDLYFVLSEGYALLGEIIDPAESKFGDAFNARLFLEQLVFLDDVEDTEVQILSTGVTRAEILKFLENDAKRSAEEDAANI
jgi:hypothetical protein